MLLTHIPASSLRPKYAHATIEMVLEEVFSMWSAPCPVLGNDRIHTHYEKHNGPHRKWKN
jgi:hypothetical protein